MAAYKRKTDKADMPANPDELIKAVWNKLVDFEGITENLWNMVEVYHDEHMEMQQYVYGGKGRKSIGDEINSLWKAHDDCRNDIQHDIKLVRSERTEELTKIRNESNAGDWHVLGKMITIVSLYSAVVGGVIGALVAFFA